MAKNSAKSKGYRRQNAKKPYLSKRDISILCVIVALLAVGAYFLFSYDDGALKVQDGAVVADGDNWLIVDGSNVRGRSRYYKLGEIGEIDGYTREKVASANDINVPQYEFTPAEEGDDSTKITVSCGHSTPEAIAKYTMSTLSTLPNNTLGDLHTDKMADRKVCYYIYTTEPAETPAEDTSADTASETPAEAPSDAASEASTEDTSADTASESPAKDASAASDEAADSPSEAASEASAEDASKSSRYAKTLIAYFEATHDSVVYIHLDSLADAPDACLTDDEMLTLLNQSLSAIAFETGK